MDEANGEETKRHGRPLPRNNRRHVTASSGNRSRCSHRPETTNGAAAPSTSSTSVSLSSSCSPAPLTPTTQPSSPPICPDCSATCPASPSLSSAEHSRWRRCPGGPHDHGRRSASPRARPRCRRLGRVLLCVAARPGDRGGVDLPSADLRRGSPIPGRRGCARDRLVGNFVTAPRAPHAPARVRHGCDRSHCGRGA